MQRHPIERRRHALGLRQTDLAERIGVSPQTIRSWEAGKNPYATRLPRIAQVLEVDALTLRDELDQWAARQPGLFDARPRRRRRVDMPPTTAGDAAQTGR
jgi:transcriptional regulator with XRE-family HTH domain